MIPVSNDEWYKEEHAKFRSLYGEELKRLLSWEECEIEPGFLGFLGSYADIQVPEDFVVFDFGCYMGIQAAYFADNAAYVGVDIAVPEEWRFQQDNVVSFQQSIQQFIRETLPKLDVDLNRCVAICSFVPDDEAQQLVAATFPYHFVVYCDDIISENLPGDEIEEDYEK